VENLLPPTRSPSPDTRRKISAALRGRTRPPETVAKIAAAAQDRWADPSERAAQSDRTRLAADRREESLAALALAPRTTRIAQVASDIVRRAKRGGRHSAGPRASLVLEVALAEGLLAASDAEMAQYLLEA
jgi:hypothetical protein